MDSTFPTYQRGCVRLMMRWHPHHRCLTRARPSRCCYQTGQRKRSSVGDETQNRSQIKSPWANRKNQGFIVNLNFVTFSLIDNDFITETLENINILFWLLDHLNPLSSHFIHCPEDIKLPYPFIKWMQIKIKMINKISLTRHCNTPPRVCTRLWRSRCDPRPRCSAPGWAECHDCHAELSRTDRPCHASWGCPGPGPRGLSWSWCRQEPSCPPTWQSAAGSPGEAGPWPGQLGSPWYMRDYYVNLRL